MPSQQGLVDVSCIGAVFQAQQDFGFLRFQVIETDKLGLNSSAKGPYQRPVLPDPITLPIGRFLPSRTET